MFTIPSISNPNFTAFAFIGALVLFVLVEAIRLARLYPVYTDLSNFLNRYLDSREDGPLIVSHIYLLLGCAAPVILSRMPVLPEGYETAGRIGLSLSGMISLGIGDSFASIVGISFGRRLFPPIPGTKKSFEGMLGKCAWLVREPSSTCL